MRGTLFTKKLVLIGMLSAVLIGGQLMLAFLSNIEVVTLFILLFTTVFGLRIAMPTVLIFVAVEAVIFGLNTWVISYFIYWPLLALAAAGIKRAGKDKHGYYVLCAVGMTLFFGVLTSLVDALFAMSYSTKTFWMSFAVFYVSGIRFFAVHILSNFIVVASAFVPLKRVLTSLKGSYFGDSSKIV